MIQYWPVTGIIVSALKSFMNYNSFFYFNYVYYVSNRKKLKMIGSIKCYKIKTTTKLKKAFNKDKFEFTLMRVIKYYVKNLDKKALCKKAIILP